MPVDSHGWQGDREWLDLKTPEGRILGHEPATRYDESSRMVETGKLRPEEEVSETIGLNDVNDKLAAMTDFDTAGVPVIDEFWARPAQPPARSASAPANTRVAAAQSPQSVHSAGLCETPSRELANSIPASVTRATYMESWAAPE